MQIADPAQACIAAMQAGDAPPAWLHSPFLPAVLPGYGLFVELALQICATWSSGSCIDAMTLQAQAAVTHQLALCLGALGKVEVDGNPEFLTRILQVCLICCF